MKSKSVLMLLAVFLFCCAATGCKKYSVIYDGNGSTGGSVPADTATYRTGALVTVLGNTGALEKTGHDFAGWNTAADGSGAAYSPGATFKMGKEVVTLYASWTQGQSYSVTYDGNGATGGTPPVDAGSYTQGATVTVLDNTGGLVKTGYTFEGWNTAADGSGTYYGAGWTFSLGAQNITLYASWILPSNYSVTYDGNGATEGTPPVDSNSYAQSATVTVLGNKGNLLKTDCNFAGWNTAADGSGTYYSSGAKFGPATFAMGSADALLYGQWAGRWTRQMGVTGQNVAAKGIAIDVSGNSYIAGHTFSALDGQILTGTSDVLIVKHDSSGTRQWTRLLGASGAGTKGNCITADANGNMYVAGYTDGALDGQTKTGLSDAFIVKYNANGERQWTRQLGAAAADTYAEGLAVDADGNCHATGRTYGALEGQTLTGIWDVFAVKYDSSGARQWLQQWGTSGDTEGYDIDVDASGNSYVTGSTTGALEGQTLTGSYDMFITKLNTAGARQWTRQLGVAGDTFGQGIAVDADGNCYATGYTNGALDGQTKTGLGDACLVKYSTDGVRQWTRLLGVAGQFTSAKGITLDAGGGSYITGYTYGALDGQPISGSSDAFASRYDSSGARQWTRLLGAAAAETQSSGIAIDANGAVHIVGHTYGALDGQTLTGAIDLFISTRLNQ